jgi:hypothetical protein
MESYGKERVARSHIREGAALLMALAAMTGGCSDNSSGPETYPVIGTVTMDGKPVAGAVIQFMPDSSSAGALGGQASTAADGGYDVSVFLDQGKSTKRGLPAGSYRVTIVKMESAAGAASLDKPPKNVLPAKYAATETTPLTKTVQADRENRFDFVL